jgi:putative ABC transport system permease protein
LVVLLGLGFLVYRDFPSDAEILAVYNFVKLLYPLNRYTFGAFMRQLYYFYADAALIALRSIFAQKMRAFLTLIGIIIGVSSVVVVGASISGFNDYIVKTVSRILGVNHFMMDRFATRENGPMRTGTRRQSATRNSALRTTNGWQRTAASARSRSGDQQQHRLKYEGKDLFGTQINGVTANMGEIENKDHRHGAIFSSTRN